MTPGPHPSSTRARKDGDAPRTPKPPSPHHSSRDHTDGEAEEEEERKRDIKDKRKHRTSTPKTPVASRSADEFTPSTAEDHRVFDGEDKLATRGEFRRMRRLMQEMRTFLQDIMSDQAEDVATLKRDLEEARTWATSAKVSATKLKSGIKDNRSDMHDMKEEIKEVIQVHRDRMDGLQQALNDRDDGAETIHTIVDELNIAEVWDDLTNKEYRITVLEECASHQSPGGEATRACTAADPKGDQTIEDNMMALELAVKELASAPKNSSPQYRKPTSEFRVIQNVAPLTGDKLKFREWSTTFVNAMGQVDPLYTKAIKKIMHWANSDVSPDLEHGWPQRGGVAGIGEMDDLNVELLGRDLLNVLMEQTVGTVSTRVTNGETRGGIHVYTEVYKWFTETSGLGLAEQAR